VPRIPEDCAGEDRTIARVCVAPSVWQCLISIPRKCKLFIYLVRTSSVSDPVHSRGEVHDFSHTGEKWITDHDIQSCGGRIVMMAQGCVEYTDDVEGAIRQMVGYPVRPADGSDGDFWSVRNGEWLLKDGTTST
jgi:hypothetical protein